MEIKVQQQGNTLWEDIGIAEYNQETRTWECRIGDCEAKIETENAYRTIGEITSGTILWAQQTGHDIPVLQKDAECNGQIIHPYGSNAERRKLEY